MNYLDLRRIPTADMATRGPELAHRLLVVLDNAVYDLGTISDEPEGRAEAGLPKNRELVVRVQTDKGTFSILLERVPRDDGLPIWQFSNVTVSRLPDLYRERFAWRHVDPWGEPGHLESGAEQARISLVTYWMGLVLHRASAAFRARVARCAGLSPFHRT